MYSWRWEDQLNRRPRVQLALGGSAEQETTCTVGAGRINLSEWDHVIYSRGARMDTVHLSIKAVMETVNQRIFGVHRTG